MFDDQFRNYQEANDSFSSNPGKQFVNSVEKTSEILNSFIKDNDAYKMSNHDANRSE